MTAPLVLLVDDDPDARGAYGRLLRVHGYHVRTHESAEALLAEPELGEAACLLLDLRMPGLSGLALQAELARRGIEVPVIFLTGHGDVGSSVRAMKSGAVDFLQKPVGEAELTRAVDAALALSADRRRATAGRALATERLARLSAREREVLSWVVEGRRSAEIARTLGIGEQTVRVHRMRAMEKLGVSSLAGLIDLWRSGEK